MCEVEKCCGKYCCKNNKISDEFKKELTILINKHCIENGSYTPDFIISDYLIKCLENLNLFIKERNNYYYPCNSDK